MKIINNYIIYLRFSLNNTRSLLKKLVLIFVYFLLSIKKILDILNIIIMLNYTN